MLVSVSGWAQFSFNVTKTDETCTGNATLTFQLNNQNPQAAYTFVIYKLPNTTTPLLVTTSTFVEFLAHGTYIIEALENLNGNTTVQTQQITIENFVVPLTYYIVETPTNCGITIEVVTIDGNPVSYEIFSGPQTYPLQESNIFTGLEYHETYQIRIYDDCGEGYVRTHTIENAPLSHLGLVSNPPELVDCDTVRIYYTTSSSEAVSDWEITATTVFSDGTEEVFTVIKDIAEGIVEAAFYIDYPYDGISGSFEVSFLDHCEETIKDEKELVTQAFFDIGKNECGNVYFSLNVEGLLYPFTVEFTQSPDGFNPLDYNENHPYFSQNYILYGMMDNELPFGEYTIKITDDCGFEQEFDFTSEYLPDDPILGFGNNGCGEFAGYFLIKFQTDRMIVSGEIISGPPEAGPYPVNIDDTINEDGDIRVENYPEGIYTVVFTDFCGFEYEVEVEIPEQTLIDFLSSSYIACEDLHGTLRMYSLNGHIVEASIIAAPGDFPYSLPYDAIAHITTNGVLFFPSVPMGDYLVQATDSCGYSNAVTVTVKGDIYNQYPYIEVVKHCNIFDIFFDHSLLRPYPLSPSESHWLQYYNEATGEWGHPYTGVSYTSGTVPTDENSIEVLMYGPIYELLNVGIFGDFRIVKVFTTVLSDSPYQAGQCIKESYYEFTYDMSLTITNAYRIICEGADNNLQNIFIQAEGIEPLSYYIIQKNGQPFFVDNGTNNIFTDLEPGIYTFQVTDPCGNIRNRDFDLADVELMVANGQTDTIPACTDSETGMYEIYLPDRNIHLVASTLSLDYFTFSYHLSYDDAYNNESPLPDYYSVEPGIYTIYVRIENNLIEGCFNIAYFDLVVVETPQVSAIQTQYALCENQENLTISLEGLFDNYLWYDGSTESSIEITTGGTYSVTVYNNIGNAVCENEITFTVSASSAPVIENIVVQDWTYFNNSITVEVSGIGNYSYSLDGVFYQQSNVFSGLQTGYYTIFVQDINGCGDAVSEALLLNYPRYFTPNGDGIHDFWRIPLSTFEPDMKISIFDRYGKLLKVFRGDEFGWDGTYNGKMLHSTDYWFTVERKNGVIKRGHFSMKR